MNTEDPLEKPQKEHTRRTAAQLEREQLYAECRRLVAWGTWRGLITRPTACADIETSAARRAGRFESIPESDTTAET